MSHRGGGPKSDKNCHILFKWPLNSLVTHFCVNDLGKVTPDPTSRVTEPLSGLSQGMLH